MRKWVQGVGRMDPGASLKASFSEYGLNHQRHQGKRWVQEMWGGRQQGQPRISSATIPEWDRNGHPLPPPLRVCKWAGFRRLNNKERPRRGRGGIEIQLWKNSQLTNT